MKRRMLFILLIGMAVVGAREALAVTQTAPEQFNIMICAKVSSGSDFVHVRLRDENFNLPEIGVLSQEYNHENISEFVFIPSEGDVLTFTKEVSGVDQLGLILSSTNKKYQASTLNVYTNQVGSSLSPMPKGIFYNAGNGKGISNAYQTTDKREIYYSVNDDTCKSVYKTVSIKSKRIVARVGILSPQYIVYDSPEGAMPYTQAGVGGILFESTADNAGGETKIIKPVDQFNIAICTEKKGNSTQIGLKLGPDYPDDFVYAAPPKFDSNGNLTLSGNDFVFITDGTEQLLFARSEKDMKGTVKSAKAFDVTTNKLNYNNKQIQSMDGEFWNVSGSLSPFYYDVTNGDCSNVVGGVTVQAKKVVVRVKELGSGYSFTNSSDSFVGVDFTGVKFADEPGMPSVGNGAGVSAAGGATSGGINTVTGGAGSGGTGGEGAAKGAAGGSGGCSLIRR